MGQSMAETLNGGDEILVNRFIYKVTDPRPNDVIVFLPNGNEKSHYYIKRVIAVPGDTLQIKNGEVYVNGELFAEDVDVAQMEDAGLAAEEITLGEDEYFVLGETAITARTAAMPTSATLRRNILSEKSGSAWHRLRTLDFYKTDSKRMESNYAVSVVPGAYDEGKASDAGRH